ncbi:PAS domain-containing protein [Breoghania sp.]|uniref:PAS domain-containing protein n=1 Tax=Breoghania sp. TaxID=2065378 RepID=UPI0032047767
MDPTPDVPDPRNSFLSKNSAGRDRPRAGFDPRALTAELLRSAFKHAPEPGLVVDHFTDTVLHANKATTVFFRKVSAEVTGTTIDRFYPKARGALHVFTKDALEREAAWTRDLKLTGPTGQPLRLEHRAIAARWDDRTAIVMAIVDLDEIDRRSVDEQANSYHREGLEEWRRAERYFREIEREHQLILAAAGEGIYGVNVDGVTTFLNPAAEKMLDYSARELVGKDMHSVIHHHKCDGSLPIPTRNARSTPPFARAR